MNANKLSDTRQTEVHTADPLLPQSSCLWLWDGLCNVGKVWTASTDSIQAEHFQAGDNLTFGEP